MPINQIMITFTLRGFYHLSIRLTSRIAGVIELVLRDTLEEIEISQLAI